jgi:hypothetical protein
LRSRAALNASASLFNFAKVGLSIDILGSVFKDYRTSSTRLTRRSRLRTAATQRESEDNLLAQKILRRQLHCPVKPLATNGIRIEDELRVARQPVTARNRPEAVRDGARKGALLQCCCTGSLAYFLQGDMGNDGSRNRRGIRVTDCNTKRAKPCVLRASALCPAKCDCRLCLRWVGAYLRCSCASVNAV